MIETARSYDKNILVVDDEALIRMDLVDHFEDAGYRVFEAENADQAIMIMKRCPSINVVLTDIQMPGSMDGLCLAHYIRDRYPLVPLVIASGELQPPPDKLPRNSLFISKPLDPAKIMTEILHPFK